MKVLVLGLILGFLLIFTSHTAGVKALQENEVVKPKPGDLEISIAADKRTYKPGDRFRLEVNLINNDAVKNIYVYGTLQFGVRASFRLFRRNAKGKEVPTRFIDSGWELPPKADEVSAFVKLLPFHFLGTTYRSTIYLLHMEKPGKYRMWVEYNSPIPAAHVPLSPFWGSESGTIKSNVVEIKVLP